MGSRGSSCWTPRRASNGCTPRCSRPQRSVEPAPQNRSKESGQIWDHEEMNKLWRNYMKKWGQTDSSLKGIGIYWNLSKVRCKTNPSLTESMTNSRCMPVPMPTVPRFFCCFTPLKQGYGSVHWAFPGSLFLRSWLLLSAWEQPVKLWARNLLPSKDPSAANSRSCASNCSWAPSHVRTC